MSETTVLGELGELPEILSLYEEARAFMAAAGNPTQWGINRYPPEELLREDIEKKRLYVIKREGAVCAAFVLFEGEEPTYRVIEEGEWPNDKPYLTIHRLASKTNEHGCAKAALDFAREYAKERGLVLRADTHEDNAPVRHILEKYGFRYCGIIHVANGSRRRAYLLDSEEL